MPIDGLFLLARADGGASALPQLILPLVIFGIFYWILFAPMRKRQKALAAVIENLKKGDKVLTTGGLYGEVAAVDANVIHLRIADNVKVKVAKSAIAGLESDSEEGVRS
jgi:preprotein translocase subunit YajC